MGGIQSTDAGAKTNASNAVQSEPERFRLPDGQTFQSFQESASSIAPHSNPPELRLGCYDYLWLDLPGVSKPNQYDVDPKNHHQISLTRGLYWLFFGLTGDPSVPALARDNGIPPRIMDDDGYNVNSCIKFANHLMRQATEAGICPETLCATAQWAQLTEARMDVESLVAYCMPCLKNGEKGFEGSLREAESRTTVALGFLKQADHILEGAIAQSFGYIKEISDYTKHIYACRRHKCADLAEDVALFSDVEAVRDYEHGPPVPKKRKGTIPIFVIKDYGVLGKNIKRIAYLRLHSEIIFQSIQQLKHSSERKHALIVGLAASSLATTKLPVSPERLKVEEVFATLRRHAEEAIETDDKEGLSDCIRVIETWKAVAPKLTEDWLNDVRERIAIDDSSRDIDQLANTLRTTGLTGDDFQIVGHYEPMTAIRLALARARNPGLDMAMALGVLVFVARDAVRQNTPPAHRAALIDAVRGIGDKLSWSELHRQRAAEIDAFLAGKPFNSQ